MCRAPRWRVPVAAERGLAAAPGALRGLRPSVTKRNSNAALSSPETVMAETKTTQLNQRPISPHLQIYRPMLTMMMSIVHRVTGAALYFGTLLLVWWLLA